MVAAEVSGWKNLVHFNVVRKLAGDGEVLMAVADPRGGPALAKTRTPVVIGWGDHNCWHECRAELTKELAKGSRAVHLRLIDEPMHLERRRHVRAMKVRSAELLHSRGDHFDGTMMDISEAAVRVRLPGVSPVQIRDRVQVVFRHLDKSTGDMRPVVLTGSVRYSRRLTGQLSQYKDVIVEYSDLVPKELDEIRRIVYDLDLQARGVI